MCGLLPVRNRLEGGFASGGNRGICYRSDLQCRALAGGMPDQSGKAGAKNIEVILVSDVSTDGSREIAARYAQRNGNFTLVDRENGGLSAARNTGLDRARGEYVYFLDSDDYLAENALEILYTKASQENLDVLKFSAYTFTDGCENFAWESDGGYKYKGCYPGIYRGMDALQMFLANNDSIPNLSLIHI